MKDFPSRKAGGLCAALAFASCSFSAMAATQVFSGLDNQDLSGGGAHPIANAARADFAAAAGSTLVQNFDAVAIGAVPSDLAAPFAVHLDVSTADTAGIMEGPTPAGTYPTAGRFLDVDAFPGDAYFTITFALPARAIGFDITDASDWKDDPRAADNLVVTLLFSGGEQAFQLFAPTDPDDVVNGTFGFFGAVSDEEILGFSITNPASNLGRDHIGIDNLRYAAANSSAVPLPAAAWMLLSALAGASRLVRRRA